MVEGRGSTGEGVVALGARRRSRVVVMGARRRSRVMVLGARRRSRVVVLGPRSRSRAVVLGPGLLASLASCCRPRASVRPLSFVGERGVGREGRSEERGVGSEWRRGRGGAVPWSPFVHACWGVVPVHACWVLVAVRACWCWALVRSSSVVFVLRLLVLSARRVCWLCCGSTLLSGRCAVSLLSGCSRFAVLLLSGCGCHVSLSCVSAR